ncbi:MAG: Pyridoxal 5'-phosphate synthase subunit PdxT [candidate division WS2 bacterium]|uniref:Pyridoxal 5'-phosphate synthase subunit PdxT n=1 Tax=Psychracetigena formicireducens TaxID=2986056 RepID=A0A9E2BI87_PSYF1|nr:Pyridoxal 5'-phosphate synthase subunit PdxT [Candidatus Psychracetigena formicireducens]MBT9144640.1 Pyridoxal 5'-phosphate synthase subunit PdxT [Candidatus Psychracetigena formicireducens]
MNIGILSLQGAFIEHQKMLTRMGLNSFLVKEASDLDKIDGIILPGGESTSMRYISQRKELWSELKIRLNRGLPVFGTCAGAILLSKAIIEENAETLGLIDVQVRRNAYGRQIDSFEDFINLKFSPEKDYLAVFIRAPGFEKIGPHVELLAEYQSQPVLLRENNILISSFHPELTDDLRIHSYFMDIIKSKGRRIN